MRPSCCTGNVLITTVTMKFGKRLHRVSAWQKKTTCENTGEEEMSEQARKGRFSAQLVADILRKKLSENLDAHQHRGEFAEGCLQCERCKLIREIAQETHQPQIIQSIFGRPRRLGHSAFVKGAFGERLLTDDTDMRVRGRTRSGK